MLWNCEALLRLKVTVFFYSSFARVLGSDVELHSPVVLLSSAIVVQTVNVLIRNVALLIWVLLFKAWRHWSSLIRGLWSTWE